MAGVYIHIPFCKKRCLYCDFFSTTLLERRTEYVETLLKEIQARKDEAHEPIRTIYLGGGTPSTLEANDIRRILEAVGTDEAQEITMEMNPGDASLPYLHAIRSAGVNRLSIGAQCANDELLRLIGRRHNWHQVELAVRRARAAGFKNISLDLIYGLPSQNIQTALQLRIQHISCYGLMYEEGTPLTQQMEAGTLEAIDEETENAMYDELCNRLKTNSFVHYEVSNFALPDYEAKHNSSYWNGTPYIGIGAGAHSYIGHVRSWNPDSLDAYMDGINNGTLVRESETLTDKDLYNERIMLGLRTNQGISGAIPVQLRSVIGSKIQQGLLRQTDDHRIVATQQGIHILNRIIEDLMI